MLHDDTTVSHDSGSSATAHAPGAGREPAARPVHPLGMPDFTYLIIGGGMTAAAAAKGIRKVDPKGSIGILAAEGLRPYARPPLSKALWQGKPEESVWLDLPAGAQLVERRATAIDRPVH